MEDSQPLLQLFISVRAHWGLCNQHKPIQRAFFNWMMSLDESQVRCCQIEVFRTLLLGRESFISIKLCPAIWNKRKVCLVLLKNLVLLFLHCELTWRDYSRPKTHTLKRHCFKVSDGDNSNASLTFLLYMSLVSCTQPGVRCNNTFTFMQSAPNGINSVVFGCILTKWQGHLCDKGHSPSIIKSERCGGVCFS